MEKIYKSSIGSLFRNFIVILFFTLLVMFLIIGVGGMILERNTLHFFLEDFITPIALTLYAIAALVFSFCMSFLKHNVTVRVTKECVTLMKGKKPYLTLSSVDYFFSSYIHRQVTQVGVYTSKYLRTVAKATQKQKDYRLYFSKKEFENLIASVTSLNMTEIEEAAPAYINEDIEEETPANIYEENAIKKFVISNRDEIKSESKKKFKKIILSGIITCLVILVVCLVLELIYMDSPRAILISISALFVLLLLPTVILLTVPAYSNYRSKLEKIPYEICITGEQIYIDGQVYKYSDITQIRVTPPSYDRTSNKIHRMMTVVDKNNKKTVYFMGFTTFEKMKFADYAEFCNSLKQNFINNPEKFIYDL